MLKAEVDGLHVQLARLDLREVQDVVDDAEQGLGRQMHLLHVVALTLVQISLECQLRHADDGVHGRTDFVAHVGQEVALGLARGVRRLLGQAEILGKAFEVGHVAEGNHGAHQLVALPDGDAGVLGREAGTVLTPQHLVVHAVDLPRRVGQEHWAFLQRIIRAIGPGVMNQAMHPAPDEILRRPAQHPGASGVQERDPALGVDAEDALAHRLQQQPAALFRHAQLGFGRLACLLCAQGQNTVGEVVGESLQGLHVLGIKAMGLAGKDGDGPEGVTVLVEWNRQHRAIAARQGRIPPRGGNGLRRDVAHQM